MLLILYHDIFLTYQNHCFLENRKKLSCELKASQLAKTTITTSVTTMPKMKSSKVKTIISELFVVLCAILCAYILCVCFLSKSEKIAHNHVLPDTKIFPIIFHQPNYT